MASASGRFPWIRVLAAAGVIGAALLYYSFSVRQSAAQRLRRRIPSVVAWESEQRPFWESLSYVKLSNAAGVRRSVRSAIIASPLLKRLTDAQSDRLIAVVSQALFALGAQSPDEYLKRIEPLRALRSSLADDMHLLLSYKMMTESPMPGDMPPREVLEKFWRGAATIRPRCSEASIGDRMGLVFGLTEWDGKSRQKWEHDDNNSEKWANPASTTFVRLTAPAVDFHQIVDRHGQALRLSIDLVVRNKQKHCVPICLIFAWDPDATDWSFVDAFIQTDERLFWPI